MLLASKFMTEESLEEFLDITEESVDDAVKEIKRSDTPKAIQCTMALVPEDDDVKACLSFNLSEGETISTRQFNYMLTTMVLGCVLKFKELYAKENSAPNEMPIHMLEQVAEMLMYEMFMMVGKIVASREGENEDE